MHWGAYRCRFVVTVLLSAWFQVAIADKSGEDGLLTNTPERDNLMRNPGLELASSRSKAMFWQPFMIDFSYVSFSTSHSGKHALYLALEDDATSTNDAWRGVGQYVYVNQSIPVELELSAWAKGYRLSDPARVFVDLKYTDGTWDMDRTLLFTTGTFDWQQSSMLLHPRRPVEAAFVFVVLFGNARAAAYFDDFVLMERPDLPDPTSVRQLPDPAVFKSSLESSTCPDGALRVHHNFLQGSSETKPADVTLATQLSPDRVDRLQQLASRYQGPISAAVYVRDPEAEMRTLLDAWSSDQGSAMRAHATVHLVFPCAPTRAAALARDYPINFLRNVAWHLAPTEQLLLLDVDFMPSEGLHASLRARWPRLRRVRGLQRAVFVVPAFEMTGQYPWPKDKAELYSMVLDGQVKPVHEDKLASAHGATSYRRWYTATNAYEVEYQLQYEPYVLIAKDAPAYDDKFVGYGQDKVSHAYELSLADYRFVVLPDVFVIHLDHPVPKWRSDQNVTRVWVNWYSFVYDRERAHGGGLFSPNAGGVSGRELESSSKSPFCTDTCRYAKDGYCDDGGDGADYSGCPLGSDCTDCGDRTPAGFAETMKAAVEGRERRSRQHRALAAARGVAGPRAGGGGGARSSAPDSESCSEVRKLMSISTGELERCAISLETEQAAARDCLRRSERLTRQASDAEARYDRVLRERNIAVGAVVELRDQLAELALLR
mmetsp:Transcript_13887/g.44486  ORF Transcript_13887/g.44486 Transcript_13887/m.44486 type:complete len:715 (+) Transcript_13887:44-2188(+)